MMTPGLDDKHVLEDKHLLDDADHVLHGEAGSGAGRQSAYAVYVAFLLTLTYGFTISRALFITSDAQWVREQLAQPLTWGLGVCGALLVGWLVRRAGRDRGPITPPLPWVDHVAISGIDRALVLRQWWRTALVGGVTAGVLTGGVLGGGLVAAGVAGPGWLLLAVGGAAIGFGWALAWLWGQLASDREGGSRFAMGSGALRQLSIDGLRAHSGRAGRLHGAVLAGDLRAARLEVAAPVTRARDARLRPGRPFTTVIRRDLLGLRRRPGSPFIGALLIIISAAMLSLFVVRAGLPWPLVPIAVFVSYLGMGQFADGLRYQGDNAGTPPLLGLPFRSEAIAHLVIPVLVHATLTATCLLLAVNLSDRTPSGARMVCLVASTAILAGAQLAAAFRGQPPTGAFVPQSGPQVLIFWYAAPALLAIGATTLALALPSQAFALWWGMGCAVAFLAHGLHAVRRLETAHRI